jgi:hypothetical protein
VYKCVTRGKAVKGVTSWWEYNFKVCSNAMNTGRKVKIGFLVGNMDQWGTVLTTVIKLSVPWQWGVSWPLGILFTRNDNAPSQGSEPRMNTGLAYSLESEVTLIWRSEGQKVHSSVLTSSTDSCHSSWFSQKYYFSCFLLRRWETGERFQQILALILRIDTLSLSKKQLKSFYIICGVFWAITPLAPCRSRSFLYSYNNTGYVHINVTLRRVRVTIDAMGKH